MYAPTTRELYVALCDAPPASPPRPAAPPGPALPPRPERPERAVLEAVAHVFEVEPRAMIGGSRHRPVVEARHAAAWLLHTRHGMSLASIGRLLGGRDHTTVAYGVRQAQIRAARDPHYAACLAALAPPPTPEPDALLGKLEALDAGALADWTPGELEDLLAALSSAAGLARAALEGRIGGGQ